VHSQSAARYPGKQALEFFEGISAQSAGARGLCLHLVTIPPGGHARPHVHQDHETAVYVLSGAVVHRYGEGLRERVILRAGDFLYIPAGMPHSPANLSQTEPASAIVARTDPQEQESVVLRPDLDGAA
jgi:uncharacterized RmlC-like cupin family protein